MTIREQIKERFSFVTFFNSEFQTTKSITHNTIEPPTIEFKWIDNKTI